MENIIAVVILINYSQINVITFLVDISVSVIIIVAAIAGPLWITTEEKIPWMSVNSSLIYKSHNYTVSYIVKTSNASLWILCSRQGKIYLNGMSAFNFKYDITFFCLHCT